MEPVRNEFENDDHEAEERKEKIFNEQDVAKIEALKAEAAAKKEVLRKKKQACQDKEDQLKAMQEERNRVKEKHVAEKRILEQKLKEIGEKNELMRRRKQGQEEERQRCKDEKEESKKKKDALSVDRRPVITEEMQAQYEAQITELKEKVEATRRSIFEIENRHKEIEREINAAQDYGKDLSDHKQELVNQIAELGKKLIENTQEQNKLLKEKEEFEEKLKLNKMADHCERGNSMVAEIEDGNRIMERNLKIFNQKCIEIKKKIALKSFELGKLRESHANLLYDLKKKNNNSKSAYGVVQGEIDEFKKKIQELEHKMDALLQIEDKVHLPAGDDSMQYLKTMFTSKMKTVRDAVLECQEISKQTFVKREALFQLEFEFRNLKSELRECQNHATKRRDELKSAIEESERTPDTAAEELDLKTIPHNSNAILQPTPHPQPFAVEIIQDIEENPTVNVGEIITGPEQKDAEDFRDEMKTSEDQEIGEAKKDNVENLDNSTSAKHVDIENIDQNRSFEDQKQLNNQNKSEECEEQLVNLNRSLDSKKLDIQSQSLEEQNSSNELVTPNTSSNKEDISSDQLNASSFLDEKSLEGKFKNANSSLTLGKENCDLNDSTFVDEEGLASKFKNINSSLTIGNVAGRGRASNSRNLLQDFTNTSSSIDEEELVGKFRNINSSLVKNMAGGQRASNSRNLLHDFTNTSSSIDEDSLGSKFKNVRTSLRQDNLASELMFADKENSDLINF